MSQQLSRRQALTGLTLAGATGLLPIAAASLAQARSVDRIAWDRAFATYEAAKREYEAFDAIHTRIMNACEAEVKAVPHVAFGPDPHTGDRAPTTADWFYVRRAQRLVQEVKAGKCHLETERYPSLEQHWVRSQKVAAAADKREATIEAIRMRHGMAAADEKLDDLLDAFSTAQTELLLMPAPDRPALLWKLEHLLSIDNECTSSWTAEYVAQTSTDVRRLLAA